MDLHSVFCERNIIYVVSVGSKVAATWIRTSRIAEEPRKAGIGFVISDQADTSSRLVESEVYAGVHLSGCSDIHVIDMALLKSIKVNTLPGLPDSVLDDLKSGILDNPAGRRRGLNMALRGLYLGIRFLDPNFKVPRF